MESILETVLELWDELILLISEHGLYVAGAGLALTVLIIVFLRFRAKRNADDWDWAGDGAEEEDSISSGNGDDGFLEVGPEPVIVYRKKEIEEPEQPKAPEYKPPTPQPELQAEPEPQKPEPMPEYNPEPQPPEPDSKPEPMAAPEYEPEPTTAPEYKPAPQPPDPEPKPEPMAVPEYKPDPEPIPVYNPEPEPEPQPQMPGPEPEPQFQHAIPKPSIPVKDSKPEPNRLRPTETKIQGGLKPQPDLYLVSEFATDTIQTLTQHGYEIEEVVYQGVFGADYIALRPGVRAYVQVKDWKKKVTENTVQEVHGYANNHSCNQAIIISLGGFNRSANKLAERLGIMLWDKRTLKKLPETQGFS